MSDPCFVEALGDRHRAEYFEHWHRDRLVGVYVDVFEGDRLIPWYSARGPYKSVKTAQRTVKQMMRSHTAWAMQMAGATAQ